jgi:hypothetical protein
MKPPLRWASTATAILLTLSCTSAPRSQTPSAPAIRCEIKFSAWCIAEGAYEITRRPALDGRYDRIWTLSGRFKPDSKMVVFEPNGCNVGFSDQKATLLNVDRTFLWQNRKWDRIGIRLKHDATCDLQILLPPENDDPMAWGYYGGLALIRICTAQKCPAQNLGDLVPQIRSERPDSLQK